MNYRDTLKKKTVKTKSSRFHEAYKKASNDVNRLIKNTKVTYFQEVIGNSKNNSKELWNVASIKLNE